MIRLTIAPEPASFSRNVREPGENALALLAGKPLPYKRKGRPLAATKSVGETVVRKKVDDFPYWTNCLDELHRLYHGICAYYGFRCEKAVLPQVDHFVAKSDPAQELAYEWSNYRLACGYANTCKNKYPDVLDPATIQDGWFQLDLNTLSVNINPALPTPTRKQIEATIIRLKLNEAEALEIRQHAMEHFRHGRANLEFLELDHPFLAKELVRQGISNRSQLPSLPSEIENRVEEELTSG